ncbi:MAG: pyridoxamine 5'-phosphate oxidase family protein [Sedimentisphaerales bacterium]|nr:pyridoxamine 5'-phosphate oxidase family protein [Sedimentisphaerales bacterium]
MRKEEREIKDIGSIEEIIRKAQVCRLALSDNDRPYIVPLCFGYKDKTLYFHCAREGKKLDILKQNNNVCFEIDTDLELVKGKKACKCSMKYRSVIGFGRAKFIEETELKRKALNIIMQNYSEGFFEYPDEVVNKTVIIKVEIESMTGKQLGY